MENEIEQQEQANDEGQNEQENQAGIEQLMSHPNVKIIAALITKWLNNSASTLKYAYYGAIIERVYMLLITLCCLGAIVLLAHLNVLDKTSAGTLIGAVIGYALAKRIDEK